MEENSSENVRLAYAVYGCILGVGFIVWCVVVCKNTSRYSSSLHKLMIVVLFMKYFYCISKGTLNMPSDKEISEFIDLTISSSFTLYNTFLYTCLLLISKGFCVYRYQLDRVDVTVISMVLGFVYLGYSAYVIDPIPLRPLVIIIIVCVFGLVVKSTTDSIKHLQQRENQQVSNRIRRMIIRKCEMLSSFLKIIYLYFGCHLFYIVALDIVIFPLIPSEMGNAFSSFCIFFHVSADGISTFLLFYTFRPTPHNSNIEILEIDEENAGNQRVLLCIATSSETLDSSALSLLITGRRTLLLATRVSPPEVSIHYNPLYEPLLL